MTTVSTHIREQAETVAAQATAIAEGSVVGPLSTAAARVEQNATMLRSWIELEAEETP